MRRGFKSWSEENAVEYRRQLGIDTHAYLPARTLAQHLSVTVVEPKDIPDLDPNVVSMVLGKASSSWSAITLGPTDCRIIIINPTHAPARQESDMMHELAHIICGHKYSSFHGFGGLSLRTHTKSVEDEAAWLGACLQIPRKALLWALGNGMAQNAQIAAYYNASIEMAKFRRKTTGVDSQLRRRAEYFRK